MAKGSAVATPRTRSAKKEAASAAANKGKSESNGKASVRSAGPGKFAVNQPPLDAMKDVDPRVPELDEQCQSFLSEQDKKKAAKQMMDEHSENIGSLLQKNELTHYTMNGKKFYIEPGSPSVKCVNVKQN